MKAIGVHAYVPLSFFYVRLIDIDGVVDLYKLIETFYIDCGCRSFIIIKTKNGYHLIDFEPVSKEKRNITLKKFLKNFNTDHNFKVLRIFPCDDFKLIYIYENPYVGKWSELVRLYELVFKKRLMERNLISLGSPAFSVFYPKSGIDFD